MNKQHAIIGFILSALAGALIMWAVNKNQSDAITADAAAAASGEGAGSETLAPPAPKNAGAVPVELYVMSQCPYGVQAVDGFAEAIEGMEADVDLKVDYIGRKDPSGELTSMHGPAEVTGDIAQLCANKIAPAKFLAFTKCQNKDPRSVATNWESCAKENGVPGAALKKCIEGGEGKKLLAASFDRAEKRGASGSPTIYLAGKSYEGRRGADAYRRAICAEYKGPKPPEACSKLAPLANVNVTILTDKRCAECDANRLSQLLASKIAKPTIKVLDYTEADGKKVYDEIGGGPLPMLLFDKTLDDDKEAAAGIGPGAQQKGDYRVLNVGGQWNPRCMDDNGCKLAECKDTLSCRKETPNTLEVFVMSQCPYGVMALDAMKEVLGAMDPKLHFRVRYIADGTAKDGFRALHGQPEVDENIRELCAAKHYAKDNKYMEYIWCRNKSIRDTNWEACAGAETGVAAAKIRTCAEGKQGPTLQEEDAKVATALGIGASPTWLVNGRYKFSGVDAETIRKNICEHNPDLTGCDKTLTSKGGQVPAGAGCGK